MSLSPGIRYYVAGLSVGPRGFAVKMSVTLLPRAGCLIRFRFSLSLAALLALQPGAWGCTTLMVTAKDGSVVSGRTMEFGFDVQSEVLVIPSGTTLSGTLLYNAKGLTYTTKYAMAGANAVRMVDLIKAAAMAAGQIRTIKMDSRQTGEEVSTRFTE